jgi:hypothetical protein
MPKIAYLFHICMFDAIISESQCSHYADLNVSFSFSATSASIFRCRRRRRRRRRRAPRRNFTSLRAENVQDEILGGVPISVCSSGS